MRVCLFAAADSAQVGAKVNGRLASPAYQLRNADVVEVLTYDGPLSQRTIHMHRQWLRSAATRTAQHKIRMLLREWGRTHPPDPEEEALTQVLEAKLSAFRLETTVQQTTAGFEEDADSENMRKLESLSLLVRCDDRLVRAPPPPLRCSESVSSTSHKHRPMSSLSAVSRRVRL